MSFIEAMQFVRGSTAIRRASWVPGLRLFWSDSTLRWKYANEFEGLLGQSRELGIESQGMITPESVCADDWEVIDA